MMIASAATRALLAGAALGALCTAASAQTSPTAVPAPTPTAQQKPTAQASQPEETKEDAIVVTGSRIGRTQFDAPNPVISLNSAAIQQSGQTNLTAFLTRVPALVGSQGNHDQAGSNAGFGQAGLNLLNLRNLGTNRTLVLVNGRRHVAGDTGTAAVDINTIPTDLVERVDVLTGSASAVYGADAVSGVVNFVLKHDFEGLSARVQQGISQRGDGANHFASITAGHNSSTSTTASRNPIAVGSRAVRVCHWCAIRPTSRMIPTSPITSSPATCAMPRARRAAQWT